VQHIARFLLIILLRLIVFFSPYQPEYHNWAFNLPVNSLEIKNTWSRIPKDVDILLTHGPPTNILDENTAGLRVGCAQLLARVLAIKPRLHVSGHIHEAYGRQDLGSTIFVNASTCNLRYQPVQAPIVVDLALKEA
jgi:Icc-related predicted phosphoesterase